MAVGEHGTGDGGSEDADVAQASAVRREAQQAARQRLAGPLISAVGELGVEAAERGNAPAGVPAAEQRAREHVERAQREAAGVVAAAAAEVTAADERYRQAHQAATEAGWSAAALADMGYASPDRPAGSRDARGRPAQGRSATCRQPALAPGRRRFSTTAMT
jgi:hypothetical protein